MRFNKEKERRKDMKIFAKLFGPKVKKLEMPKKEQIKEVSEKAAEIADNVGHEFTEAVKAKYFTRSAKAKNGGDVEMIFDNETKKLKQWKRKNPDGSVTTGKINNGFLPLFRNSTIVQGDTVTRKYIGKLADLTEVNIEKFDLSEYPKIVIKASDKVYHKTQKQPVSVTENLVTENMPDSLDIPKELYRSILS